MEEGREVKLLEDLSDLGYKVELPTKIFRRLMYRYFFMKEWGYETSITYVKAFSESGRITVEIETHRPGLLIGKQGTFIDGLRDYLREELENEKIDISIKESKLWHNLNKDGED